MDVAVIVLRVVHIGSAILWAGGSMVIERFVQPTADELGGVARPFVAGLNRRRMALYFPVVATLTVVAGAALYWIDAGHDPLAYLTAGGSGTVFGIGGIAGLLAFLAGPLALVHAARLGRATDAIARSGPTPELEARAAAARAGVRRAGRIGLVLLLLAAGCMAIARYV